MLTVKLHNHFPGSCMVGSENGVYCGHSAMIFVNKKEQKSYDCPHRFHSDAEAKDFILQVRLAVAMKHIENDEAFVQFTPMSDRFMKEQPHAHGFAIDNPRGNLQ